MKCEKCGKLIEFVNLDMFQYDGSDSDVSHYVEECEVDAAVITTKKEWVGYELTEEEMRDTISCPHCGEFPFKNGEIQLYEDLTIVCFREPGNAEPPCSFCNEELYFKAVQYTQPLLAPATPAEELRQRLINMTGETYARIEKKFCPVCGRKIGE